MWSSRTVSGKSIRCRNSRRFSCLLLFFLSVIFAACSRGGQPSSLNLSAYLDTSLLEECDLIFRMGCGLESQAVVAADKSAMYSHVGLLVREDGRWQVLHAVPGEEEDTGGEEVLKMDTLPLFLRPDRAVSVCVMRYDTSAEVLRQVREEAFRLYGKRLPFDHRYLLSDSSEVYCTEYVTRVFRKIGVELPEDRCHRFPMVDEDLVYPIDLTRNPHLKTILHLSKKK